jgi:hypothetical protein
MVGDSVAGEYIEGSASAAIQECAWGTVIHVEQPDAKSGRVTVFVDAEKAGPAGSGVQQVTKVYRNELDAAGCAALGPDVHVDKSCVPSEGGIRLVAFRTSNLFVRITCSVRNPDVCSGGRRSATAETLTKAVLRNL